ncbi:hypothetical protein OKW21_004101 [Catalinimonas alkaloidigena]|nr:hypothetical protein [Catalinimonas alkaloidigena]
MNVPEYGYLSLSTFHKPELYLIKLTYLIDFNYDNTTFAYYIKHFKYKCRIFRHASRNIQCYHFTWF